jgi:hypothetical protein
VTSGGVTGSGAGGAGGTGGGNGGDNIYSGSNISRGGNGWNIGNNGSTGNNGVSPNTTHTNGTWGLGGGGGSVGYGWCNCGGGGGGYSGGGSGQINASGGGGGSINNGTNQSNTAGNNAGNGIVIITYSTSGSVPATPTSISGNASICIGAGAQTYSISPVAGATGYTWTVPAGSNITSGQGTTSITMTPGSTSGNVTVTADNSCGSSAPATFTLTINALPNVTAVSASSPICSGASDMLTASGASTYSWSSGGTSATETVSPTTTTTYTVTGTDANGCVNTATVTVDVNALPSVSVSANDSSVCAAMPFTMTATGAVTYSWSSGGTASTESIFASSSGSYTVTGTDANGCSDAASIYITVFPMTSIVASTLDTVICQQQPVNLAATGGVSYTWNPGNMTGTPVIVYPNSSITYTLTGIDANGCSGTDFISIQVNSLPVVTAAAASYNVCLDDASVTLTGTPGGGTWSGPGITGNQFDPSVGVGSMQLVYSFTNSSGCSSADTIGITVGACVGILESSLGGGISVYPNPSNGSFFVTSVNEIAELEISITNILGQEIYSSKASNVASGAKLEIALGNISEGVYVVRVVADGKTSQGKITVKR